MRAPVVARLRLHMYEPLRMKRRRLLVQRRTIIIMFTVKKPCKPVPTSGFSRASDARRVRVGAEIGLGLNKARALTQAHAYINARVYARSRARVDAQAPARNGPGARPGGRGVAQSSPRHAINRSLPHSIHIFTQREATP